MKKYNGGYFYLFIIIAVILFFFSFTMMTKVDRIDKSKDVCGNNTITHQEKNFKYIECNSNKFKLDCISFVDYDEWGRKYNNYACNYINISLYR
jgi:hypothetical protein